MAPAIRGAVAASVRTARDVLRRSRTLYRAVSLEEYADLDRSGRLSTGGRMDAMELEKWFAERYVDAVRWGAMLHRDQPFRIIKAWWPRQQVDSFYFVPFLDRIGPARSAPCEAWPDARISVILRWWDRL
jgi:hypothetical protein